MVTRFSKLTFKQFAVNYPELSNFHNPHPPQLLFSPGADTPNSRGGKRIKKSLYLFGRNDHQSVGLFQVRGNLGNKFRASDTDRSSQALLITDRSLKR